MRPLFQMLCDRAVCCLTALLAMAVCSAPTLAIQYQDAVLNSGPVRYYRFNDAGNPAVDATGASNGTYNSFDPGDFGASGPFANSGNTAVTFDGVNNQVTAPDAADLQITGDISIEFWMNKASEAGDGQRLVGKGAPTVRTFGVWEESGPGKRLLFQQYNGSNSAVLNVFSNSAVEVGQWYHVAATVSGSDARIYINGELDATGTRTGSVGVDAAPLTIGKAAVHTYFPGRLDEVAIYNNAISAGHVKHHYNVAQGLTYPQILANDGADAHYQFFDPSSNNGDTAADSIGGNNGTYGGSPMIMSGRPGDSSNALAFSGADDFGGTNDYVALPASLFSGYPTGGSTNAYERTFETWFRTDAGGVILGQNVAGATPGVTTPAGYVPAIYVDTNGQVRSSMFWHGSTGAQIVSPGQYNDNMWHHLAVVYDNGVETLFIDGQPVGSQSVLQNAYSGAYDYWLGTGRAINWAATSIDSAGWYFFDGKLGDTAIYQEALSAANIEAHFLAGNPANVPEPATAGLVLLAVAGLARRRETARRC